MNFVSAAFLLFFPCVLALQRLLPGKYRWALLLMASWGFYLYHDAGAFVLLLLATGISYGCALGIEKFPAHKKNAAFRGNLLHFGHFDCL